MSVYIIVYWDGDFIKDKIKRICDSFQGQRFDLPPMAEIDDKINEVTEQIKNAKSVYEQT